MELSVNKLLGNIFALCSSNPTGIKVKDADRWRKVLKKCVVSQDQRLYVALKRTLEENNTF